MTPWFRAIAIVLLIASYHPSEATAQTAATAPNCSGDALISETFSNGARWEMCWESRIRENLVLSDVFYTPPNGTPIRVLSSARLSQLHVAYDDSDVTVKPKQWQKKMRTPATAAETMMVLCL